MVNKQSEDKAVRLRIAAGLSCIEAVGKQFDIRKRHAAPGISGIVIHGQVEACMFAGFMRKDKKLTPVYSVRIREQWHKVTDITGNGG